MYPYYFSILYYVTSLSLCYSHMLYASYVSYSFIYVICYMWKIKKYLNGFSMFNSQQNVMLTVKLPYHY